MAGRSGGLPAARVPTSRVPERVIEREARRVFPKLTHDNSYLCKVAYGKRRQPGYGVFVARNKWRKPVLFVEPDFVEIFFRRDWLGRLRQDQYILSDTGAAWLRRINKPHDPYQAQHRLMGERIIQAEHTANTRFQVNQGESPLGWLHQRRGPGGQRFLSDEEYQAGERLREDFSRAQLTPQVSMDWARMMTGRVKRQGTVAEGAGLSDSALDARRRLEAALEVLGPELADVVLDVCCFLNGLEAAEKQLGWPQRSAKVVLRLGLQRLARHYGFERAGVQQTGPGGTIRAWLATGAKPKIDGVP